MSHVRLRLTLAYDGSRYQGWQTQKSGQGVQELVEEALRHLFPGAGPLHGCSRTDTGVHALGLVAHVDIPRPEWRMSARKLVLALNAHLPEDIRLMRAAVGRADFHARFHATAKQYRYLIWNSAAANPLLRHVSWHVPRPLSVPAMREASKALVGQHDFAAFTANPGYARINTVRTLSRCEVRRRGAEITVVMEGSGFLYKMCRGIVGTLVQVGLGKFPPAQVAEMLAGRDRRRAGMTAPALGLILWQVRYGRAGGQAPENQVREAERREITENE